MNCFIGADITTCKLLEEFVQKSVSLDIAGVFSDSVSIRDHLLKRRDIDIVFLDNEIPGLDVFNFISSLDYLPNIIMVSSGYQNAIKAFDFNVVDYLLKPVTYSRFCKAIDKSLRYYSRKEVSNSTENDIFIKKGSSLVRLKLKDIIYIEALENYVTLYSKVEKFTIHFTLKSVEHQLPSWMFIRVHRSFIVNKSMINSISENSVEVNVGGKHKSVPLGKSFRESLINDINVMAK
jgi:DNA-binding LytR/AlgR family response regulator